MIRTGFSEGAIYVIEKGANIEVLNSYKNTPLHSACYNEMEDVALLLISKGARLDVCGMYNSISLHLACMKGLTKVIDAMIEKGANVHHKDNRGRTPLKLLDKDAVVV
jgi:ankyrin repeat protein